MTSTNPVTQAESDVLMSAANNGMTKSPTYCLWNPDTVQAMSGGRGGQGRGAPGLHNRGNAQGLALGRDDRSGTENIVPQADLCNAGRPSEPDAFEGTWSCHDQTWSCLSDGSDDFEGFTLPPPALAEEEWPLWDRENMDAELTLVRQPRA